jgi:hypothetical protein
MSSALRRQKHTAARAAAEVLHFPRVALFFFCAMVGDIMARCSISYINAIRMNDTALAASARALVSPGTLVFLD